MRHGSRRAIKIWYRSTAPVSRGGFIYFAVKGIWTHAIAALLLAILTFGLSWLIYPVFARQIVETHYLVKVRLGLLHGPVGCSGATVIRGIPLGFVEPPDQVNADRGSRFDQIVVGQLCPHGRHQLRVPSTPWFR